MTASWIHDETSVRSVAIDLHVHETTQQRHTQFYTADSTIKGTE